MENNFEGIEQEELNEHMSVIDYIIDHDDLWWETDDCLYAYKDDAPQFVKDYFDTENEFILEWAKQFGTR